MRPAALRNGILARCARGVDRVVMSKHQELRPSIFQRLMGA